MNQAMNQATTPAATVTVTDPVCGMTVDPATAAATSTTSEGTQYFCSRGCKTSFDAASTTPACCRSTAC